MAAELPGASGFRFRRLAKPEEFRAAEELQTLGPAGASDSPAPVSLMRAAQDHGGVVLGAFTDIYLAGVSVGFLGFDGSSLYHYVQRFVVRPEYQNHGLGFRLALAVRDEVRKQGLESLRGTVDPLESRAGFLLFHRLGATAERYLTHYYGQQGAAEAPDRETDRLEWRWPFAVPAVEQHLAAPRSPAPPADPRFASAPRLLETEAGDSGLRLPTAVAEPSTPAAQVEVPFDIDLVRQHEPSGARRWRHAVRDAFRAAFDLGYSVAGFEVLEVEHERRSAYLLTAPSTTAPAA